MDYWTRALLILDLIGVGYFSINYKLNATRVFLLLFLVILLGGINLILHINYYIHSKGQTLVLSKGSDSFLFGKNGVTIKYFKKDVRQITSKENTSIRCPWNGFKVTNLELTNGETLKIASIILDGYEIQRKFPGVLCKTIVDIFPFY